MNVVQRLVRSAVPPSQRRALRVAGGRVLHYGNDRFCPCCKSRVRRFGPYGVKPRPEALCPVCGALERHRLIAVFLQSNPELLRAADRLLHVAPEPQITATLRRWPNIEYLSIDSEPGRAMAAMDITDLPLDDRSFDAIYCSHVLEHVADDGRAMTEFRRVLRPGGWIALQVPIRRGPTIEDPTIVDPEERRRRFGQCDHVRFYGPDIRDRLAAAGLAVSVLRPARGMGQEDVVRLGLNPTEAIYFCRRPD